MSITPAPAYAELVCISNFSFLTGASHPQELVARAAELGYRALALTDECSLAGVVRALEESRRCAARGQPIQLIPGSLFRLESGSRLVLLPENDTGYSQLCTLITRGRRRASKGRYTLPDRCFEHGLDHCLALWLPGNGMDRKTAHWLAACFPQRAWMAVARALGPDDDHHLAQMLALAHEAGLPVTACGDVRMHVRPRRMLHDTLAAIRHGCTVSELGYRALPSGERHLRGRRRLAHLYPPDLLAETLHIARRCRFRLDQLRYQYPHEVVPTGCQPSDYLRQLTEAGIRARWPDGISAALRRQIEDELRLISELRYETYFLTVHDIVQFARGRGILCQGRGSAANSAVCYCLGITEVDPARMNMLFERFISRERDEPPDIDVDFEHQRREEVIQYIYRKYGRERAALAATVITYRTRSAIRDVGKALGFSLDQVDHLARNVSWWDQPEQLAQRLRERGLDPDNPRVRQLRHLVQCLCRFPRHLSQHVGGFVISEHPLARLVPVENAAMPGRTIIQWDKDDLETVGLLKVDCLALGMLTAIRRCLELLNEQQASAWTLADIPAEDPDTYAMIQRADTIGVFQIESRAQMAMLPRLKPACFYDLVIEVAIVRPGPIQGNMVHPYLQRRRGLAPVHYPSRALRKVLERTLGVPIFQEQVMQIAMVAAGFSGSEADTLRRSMAAWARRGGLEHLHQRLVAGMLARGYDESFAEQIFSQIRGFGEYGFPESHAASFALLVYVSAWMKCHHPAAFTCALLNAQPMGFYQPAQLVQDARRHGVEVLPVDVRYSHWDCRLTAAAGKRAQSPALRLGLRMVKGFGEAAAERLCKARGSATFRDTQDLCARVRLNRRELSALADAGALRALAGHRHRARWAAAAVEQPGADLLQGLPGRDPERVAIRPPSAVQDLQADYAATGLTLGRHPLAFIRPLLRGRRVLTAAELSQWSSGRPARACGLVTLRQRPMTASGTVFLTLEDETGFVNVIIWPRTWERHRATVLSATVLAVDGVMESDGDVSHLIAQRLHDYSDLSPGLRLRARDFC
ncbi:MAG: DNA polymerase III subunit alpha [Xanthomonadales bacterium]|nr:DNA polymerase III subunit alpha [Xanthomonadales bacterium]NIN58655.1 DNA polymerase III subunit alpha [Xanthomonadales bacterium]NIN73950.1 DNA polymerase III subunit alpha [Xanthomonadales bacterium]NIO14582.1 DNA polymerase III subunit alpha [Xanthomonadales bacterium]NIP11048.1 DNA polymerase III subunit alpha [Xanthomonadales bacterium]